MSKYLLALLVAGVTTIGSVGTLCAREVNVPSMATEEKAKAADGPEDAAQVATGESAAPSEAAAAESVADNPVGAVRDLRGAVRSGDWDLAILLILMMAVSLLRWGAGKLDALSFFAGKLGGYVLVFASSSGGMLLTVLSAGGSLSLATVSEAAVFGFGAIGGWETIKDIRKRDPKAAA